MRADELRLAVAGHEFRVDDLVAGPRIDRLYEGCETEVHREHILPGVRFHCVEDRLLAASDDYSPVPAADAQLHQVLLERPVEIPLLVRVMLEEVEVSTSVVVEGEGG